MLITEDIVLYCIVLYCIFLLLTIDCCVFLIFSITNMNNRILSI